VLKSSEAYTYSLFLSFFFLFRLTISHALVERTVPREEKHYNARSSVNPTFSLCIYLRSFAYRERNGAAPHFERFVGGHGGVGNNRELLFNSEIAPRDTSLECWRAQMGPRARVFPSTFH
jgi:hypothetical protein